MITPSFNNLTIKTTSTRRSQTNGDGRGRMGCTWVGSRCGRLEMCQAPHPHSNTLLTNPPQLPIQTWSTTHASRLPSGILSILERILDNICLFLDLCAYICC